jgi:hypothetical protein
LKQLGVKQLADDPQGRRKWLPIYRALTIRPYQVDDPIQFSRDETMVSAVNNSPSVLALSQAQSQSQAQAKSQSSSSSLGASFQQAVDQYLQDTTSGVGGGTSGGTNPPQTLSSDLMSSLLQMQS